MWWFWQFFVQRAKQREMEPEKEQKMKKIAFQLKAGKPRTTYIGMLSGSCDLDLDQMT